MKIEGKTIPAVQHIKRREAYLLTNSDKLPKTYVQAQLLRIAKIRTEKRLRWETPGRMLTQQEREERMKNQSSDFKVESIKPKKHGLISRVKGMFKAQRGN